MKKMFIKKWPLFLCAFTTLGICVWFGLAGWDSLIGIALSNRVPEKEYFYGLDDGEVANLTCSGGGISLLVSSLDKDGNADVRLRIWNSPKNFSDHPDQYLGGGDGADAELDEVTKIRNYGYKFFDVVSQVNYELSIDTSSNGSIVGSALNRYKGSGGSSALSNKLKCQIQGR